jgi:hypothetical protein
LTDRSKPKVERVVPYVRNNFFAGEDFSGITDAQRRAQDWCSTTAGMRTHGTTQWRPIEAFRTLEAPRLRPLPGVVYDVPIWAEPKVARDFHCEVARSLYSVHHSLVGAHLKARADSSSVKLYLSGQLVKVHPRLAPGQRASDPADFPAGKEVYATRDIEHLKKLATQAGPATGTYAAALLGHPLPWTKMRQVYRLLGLVKKWGPRRVEMACAKALEAEAIDVGLISRMIERAKEQEPVPEVIPANVVPGRFSRDANEFSAHKVAK